jgi:catechol 2,3-dioxygenase-like lactoylglutathione lyase family enzyme
MALKIDSVTHWSIPVNNLEESENFYRDVLGLEYKGRLGNASMACFYVDGNNILLCERKEKINRTPEQEGRTHHSFTVSAGEWDKAAKLFKEKGVEVDEIVYREKGFFTGREMYVLDPSANLIEIRDPTWQPGMPTPTFEELAASA